ncbi:hypothetical protein [Vibrio salinus]|uniref:hypothetical protein n=1 Tax=Vibrio salinus TaxID=2899784 RepID=UPI001E5E4C3F|nr:hypothetical protein [Vibrio salinus]MCE0495205.1 hypothetical protein [Vibrio salinus]
MKQDDYFLTMDDLELSVDELMKSLSEAFREQLEQNKDPLIKLKCAGAVMEFRLLSSEDDDEK